MKPQFWAHFEIWGAPVVLTLLPVSAKFDVLEKSLTRQICFWSVYSVALGWQKTPVFKFFAFEGDKTCMNYDWL